ncbi:MAG TPA: LLM class F420-dependent oxidoreductase [Candidatus Binatia bacterium]|nr:LLM class F420-dependent oxidoreductase [Candidatus Binatia bacterium]
MHHGVVFFQGDFAMRPDDVARASEDRGFESIFFVDHTHIPVRRTTPYALGGELPKDYYHNHDIFVAMSFAAAATKKIKIGSGICLVIERDPITLAKEVASLDFLSNGRVIFGIGGGWNREEMEDHGTSFPTRWKLLRERVEAMKAIWRDDEGEYHGDLVRFDKIWSWPKPVQKPHPPILLGGHGERAFDRVIRYCDGWMPLTWVDKNIIPEIGQLRERAKRAGRDPSTISVTVFGAAPDAKELAAFAEAGVARVLFGLPNAGPDQVVPALDRLAKLRS